MPKPQHKEKKISLNIKQAPTPPPAPKPKPVTKPVKPPVKPPLKPQPVVKPTEKPVEKKVIEKKPKEEVKREVLDTRKKRFAVKSPKDNNLTKPVKQKPKEVSEKKVAKKKVIKKKPVKQKRVVKRKPQKRSKDPLANFLMGGSSSSSFQATPKRPGRGNFAQKMINELYGSEFNSYTPTQKKYIKNNLSLIHQITQRELSRNGYPEVAVRMRQQGTNVVSFYLHPNGDITGLRLKKRMGYDALDDNTIEVIRIAYKDYPLPNQKTRLQFYVNYSLY